MTRLFLIRHGETIDTETKKIYKGTLDIPLSRKGMSRMKNASKFLSKFNIDFIYTSALSRSIESGQIIAKPHNLDIEVASAFNEIHFGLWEGLTFEEINKQYPKELELWLKDPQIYSPPQGEPLTDAQKRIAGGFEEKIRKHDGQTIAIVAHGGTIRIIICVVLSLKLSQIFKIAQDYGCINIIDIYENNNAILKLMNFTFYHNNPYS
ncbi:MAG: histidine phosphatase family protein [Proteobacteria bacterium]|nr:histidine phosphatase family protein [Pseudomonadota bacterium]